MPPTYIGIMMREMTTRHKQSICLLSFIIIIATHKRRRRPVPSTHSILSVRSSQLRAGNEKFKTVGSTQLLKDRTFFCFFKKKNQVNLQCFRNYCSLLESLRLPLQTTRRWILSPSRGKTNLRRGSGKSSTMYV